MSIHTRQSLPCVVCSRAISEMPARVSIKCKLAPEGNLAFSLHCVLCIVSYLPCAPPPGRLLPPLALPPEARLCPSDQYFQGETRYHRVLSTASLLRFSFQKYDPATGAAVLEATILSSKARSGVAAASGDSQPGKVKNSH